jgi:hypothetical protein
MIAIRGGVESFLARDVDNGEIPAYTPIVVIDYTAPRFVLVTPLTEET